MDNLTRRGWIVLVWIPTFLVVSLFTYATRDLCWTSNGYGSCQQMFEDESKK